MNVRFAFDVGDSVSFGPSIQGRIVLARWDGHKADYFVHYWDDDKCLCELWMDETTLSKTE